MIRTNMREPIPYLSRRGLLAGLICAPAIVRAGSLMPVHSIRGYNADLWAGFREASRTLRIRLPNDYKIMDRYIPILRPDGTCCKIIISN